MAGIEEEKMTIREAIIEKVKEAGEIMLHAGNIETGTEIKAGHANFVTEYDKKVQEFLQAELMKIVPDAVFVGEEEETHASIGRGYSFIVDPIDGTTNFMKGAKTSAISVGLLKDGEPYIGVVYNPYLKEVFHAQKGQGAWCNDQPIHVSGFPLENGIVIVGTAPYYRDELGDRTFALMRKFFDRSLDIRRSGSAALDLCSIAAGRAELFFEMRLSPWDYAAGSLIVTEAGGRVTTVDGGTLRFDQPIGVMAAGCSDTDIY